MSYNLSSIAPFSVLTLACAVIIPLLCALGVFVCLHRAELRRKLICFFILTPVYVLITVFIFSTFPEVFSEMNPMLGHLFGDVESVGFILSLTLGILYLALSALICGGGVMKRGGIITNMIITLICFGINVRIIAGIWYGILMTSSLTFSGRTVSIYNALPEMGPLLPSNVGSTGIDVVCAVIFVIYAAAFFLCFFANKTPEEIRLSDLARQHAASLRSSDETGESTKSRLDEQLPEIDRCCANCEYAQPLKKNGGQAVCDRAGIVDLSYVCRHFVNDPLKRIPFPSPVIHPEDEENNVNPEK